MTDIEILHWNDDPAGWSAGTNGVKYLIRRRHSRHRAYQTGGTRRPANRAGLRDLTEAKSPCETTTAPPIWCSRTGPLGWNSAGGDHASPVSAIGLRAGEDITWVFTDFREPGALDITKPRKHAAAGPGDHQHARRQIHHHRWWAASA